MITQSPSPLNFQDSKNHTAIHLAQKAGQKIPPLWPLQSFVAVNPFVGLADQPFEAVSHLIQKVTHESMLMSWDYFARQHADGRITVHDLITAVKQAKPNLKNSEVMTEVKKLIDSANHPIEEDPPQLKSICDIVTEQSEENWNSLVVNEVSKWLASYYDHSQSSWRMPWQKLPLYLAWKQAASIDANPELLGLKKFRQKVAALPVSSADAIVELTQEMNLPETLLEDYFHRLLMILPGWSSYVQYIVRERSRNGLADDSMLDLLAVLLAFESALLQQAGDDVATTFEYHLCALPEERPSTQIPTLALWHQAMEIGFQRKLCTDLLQSAQTKKPTPDQRPSLQAVFCIDVRSEVMRRSLESVSTSIQTLGFAGFFGMPIEHVPLGHRKGISQVPVLLSPKYRIRDYLADATPEMAVKHQQQMRVHKRLGHAWNAFKNSAVSSFSFVESAGLGFAWSLLKQTFPKQLPPQAKSHTCNSCSTSIVPNLEPHPHNSVLSSEDSGISLPDQIELARGALKNMGLTQNFAPLVVICGHGSQTTNNPYAAGLDCGACGGHAGDANAKVAAAILNQPLVRKGLREYGIDIPEDVYFIAALHNTTTDAITLFDTPSVPRTHQTALLETQLWLETASEKCRQERSSMLGLAGIEAETLKDLLYQRSQDWSQVRPEWGLAGNAAFIAAPRHRTQKLNLKGRVFLHNYSAENDPQKSTLELIMTAPMVVANWINLQYYASTVNNRLWGSGTKVTHNVVGTFGVQQGNGGDLKTGLPLQSVHNGQDWVHEPLRLSVFIEASRADVTAVLHKHEPIRQLVDNQWLHLFVIEDEGSTIHQYRSQNWHIVESAKS